MTYITAVLLFVFGLSPSTDKVDYNVTSTTTNTSTNTNTNTTNNQSNNAIIVRNPSNNNEEYDPNDFTSGTPEDINNYN